MLACSNQFCGINAIIFYAKQLFMRITNNDNSMSQAIIMLLGLVQIVATLVGGRLMDRYPKRHFLFAGEASMVVILLGIFLFSGSTSLVVALIFLHTVAYSFSIGQLLLFYASKMLDSTGYVVMVNWFATFLVALSAEFMMNNLGIGRMCGIFCLILTACLALLARDLPSDQDLLDRENALLRPLDSSKNGEKGTEMDECKPGMQNY